MVEDLLAGLVAHTAVGFHTERWAADFRACCREVLGREPATFVSPLPADPDDVGRAAASPACAEALAAIDELVGDRRVVARVDRIELSKNILRGFLAFDDLLDRYPEWRGRVTFLASVYPSRTGVPAYHRYTEAVSEAVDRINARWGDGDWVPIAYDTRDDYPLVGGRAAPGRRAAGQPDPRRPQPRGQGGGDRQRPRRRAVPLPRGGGVVGAGRRGAGGPPLRRRRHRRRARTGR